MKRALLLLIPLWLLMCILTFSCTGPNQPNNNIYVTGRGRTSDDGWGGYLSCYNDGGILQWKVELDYYYFNLAIIIMPNGSIIISNREDFHVVG